MSFVESLKQRKIVQWALAYVAGGWAFLQVLDFLADSFELPSLLVQGATGLVVVGFFVVVVLAWYHGEQGRQRVSGPELLILALLFAIAGLGVGFVGGAGNGTGVADVGAPDVIAVLPFDNFSPDPNDEYLANGLTEEITSQLAKVSDLQVISRIAVERAMESELSLREISETLGAGSVLEGSVRKAGDDIRITAQLIDAETNEHLWSRDFDRRLAGIFALQTEVALAIVDAMEAELTPEEEAEIQAPPTTNENAYALYLRDRELLGNQPETNRSAIELLKQAVELDPTFTEAWARLAWRYVWESRMGHATAADSAIGLARHALDLDPGSADAHYALASAYDALGSVAEMNASFEDALDADPMHLSTLTDYSSVGAWTGRAAASLRLVVQAVAQVPNDGNIRFHVYLPLLELGDHRLTEAWLDRAGADGMRHARLDMARMWLQVRRQEPEDAAIRALEILERYSGLPEPERTAAQVLAFLGRHEESRPILEQNARRTPDRGAAWGVALVSDRTLYALVLHETGRRADALPLFEASLTSSRAAIEAGEEWSWRPKELASIHALLENHEEALEWLEVAYEAGYRSPALARADPFFASLHGDDRFEALVDRMAAHVSEQHAQADAAGTLAMIDAINAGADPRDYLAAR